MVLGVVGSGHAVSMETGPQGQVWHGRSSSSSPVAQAPARTHWLTPFSDRALWNRIFSTALFVEHVLLGTESQIPELSSLVTSCVFSLDKVSTGLK